ncbi:MAG: protein kinase, partial [Syntrophomonadaceae bacterium]|nr:protein kinase [Syntrophomonadaceae bacterium]
VAVKILKEEYARDEGFVRKFRSEAQAAAQVSHPNIVNVFDVGEDDGRYFIVMEYVQGTTLKEYIASHAPLEPAEAVRIASEICDALEQAHAKGIIHRDIKPQNILVTADGTVKVADFGIARAPASGTITHSGNIMGSVYYISPEQARGTVLDRTTDIYSLGCVLYEMLTGRVPFDAEFPVTVALKHIHELPVEPRALNPSIPVSLETVVLTAMSKHPGDRYQSAAAMKAAMQGLSLPAGGRRSGILRKGSARPARPEEEEGMPRRKRVLSPLGVAMLVVGVIGLVAGLTFGLRGSIFGREVVVPLVEGLSASEAYQRLQEAGLTMTKAGEDFSAEVEKGSIISQDPPAQSRVKEGREVKVVVSKGKNMVDVPDLVGETLDDARLLLGNAGLEVGDVQKVFDDRA